MTTTTIDTGPGDIRRQIAIRHDRGAMLHAFVLAPSTICFATSAMGARAEGDEEKAEGDDEPKAAAGRDIPTACQTCKVENDEDAKFCKGCGVSMATSADDPDDEPAPSSKPMPKPAAQAPAKMDQSASLASILGAAGESPLALKTAAIGLRQIKDTAVGITGQTKPGAIVGALLSMPERLAQADAAAAAAQQAAATSERKTRRDLASRLNKLGLDAWPRSFIFADEIDERTGKPVTPPPFTKTIARWDLAEFEGYVSGFEKKARPRTPFDASRENASTGATAHADRETGNRGGPSVPALTDGKPTKAQIDAAKKDPTVIKMFQRPDNSATIDVIAEQYIIAAAQNGAAIGGAP